MVECGGDGWKGGGFLLKEDMFGGGGITPRQSENQLILVWWSK